MGLNMHLKIKTRADVIRHTLVATIIGVTTPVVSVAIFLMPLYFSDVRLYFGGLAVAAFVPLITIPPLAVVVLEMLRMLFLTMQQQQPRRIFQLRIRLRHPSIRYN